MENLLLEALLKAQLRQSCSSILSEVNNFDKVPIDEQNWSELRETQMRLRDSATTIANVLSNYRSEVQSDVETIKSDYSKLLEANTQQQEVIVANDLSESTLIEINDIVARIGNEVSDGSNQMKNVSKAFEEIINKMRNGLDSFFSVNMEREDLKSKLEETNAQAKQFLSALKNHEERERLLEFTMQSEREQNKAAIAELELALDHQVKMRIEAESARDAALLGERPNLGGKRNRDTENEEISVIADESLPPAPPESTTESLCFWNRGHKVIYMLKKEICKQKKIIEELKKHSSSNSQFSSSAIFLALSEKVEALKVLNKSLRDEQAALFAQNQVAINALAEIAQAQVPDGKEAVEDLFRSLYNKVKNSSDKCNDDYVTVQHIKEQKDKLQSLTFDVIAQQKHYDRISALTAVVDGQFNTLVTNIMSKIAGDRSNKLITGGVRFVMELLNAISDKDVSKLSQVRDIIDENDKLIQENAELKTAFHSAEKRSVELKEELLELQQDYENKNKIVATAVESTKKLKKELVTVQITANGERTRADSLQELSYLLLSFISNLAEHVSSVSAATNKLFLDSLQTLVGDYAKQRMSLRAISSDSVKKIADIFQLEVVGLRRDLDGVKTERTVDIGLKDYSIISFLVNCLAETEEALKYIKKEQIGVIQEVMLKAISEIINITSSYKLEEA